MKPLQLNRVDNIVTKGEIDNCGQYPLLSRCFQKSFAADDSSIAYASVSGKSLDIWRKTFHLERKTN